MEITLALIMLTLFVLSGVTGAVALNTLQKKRTEQYTSLSRGAKFLLGAYDSGSETGYYGGMKERDMTKVYKKDLNLASTLLDSDTTGFYGYIKKFAKEDGEIVKDWVDRGNHLTPPIVSVLKESRLRGIAKRHGFNLNDITDYEWDMIVKRYCDEMRAIQSKELGIKSRLESARVRNERSLKLLPHESKGYAEVTGDISPPANPWASEDNAWDRAYDQMEDNMAKKKSEITYEDLEEEQKSMYHLMLQPLMDQEARLPSLKREFIPGEVMSEEDKKRILLETKKRYEDSLKNRQNIIDKVKEGDVWVNRNPHTGRIREGDVWVDRSPEQYGVDYGYDTIFKGSSETMRPVFEIVNHLLAEGYGASRIVIEQETVVERLVRNGLTREEVFSKGLLNFESFYRDHGWTVEYDKPAYNESYTAKWIFKEA